MIGKGKEYPYDVKIILSIYSLGFLIGTLTHTIGILKDGFLSVAPNATVFFNIYWDSLTLFDPLAAILIWIKPKVGVVLAVLIMFTDIIINTYSYVSGLHGDPIPGMIPMGLFLQSLFGTYIFITAPIVLGKLKKHENFSR